MRPSTKACGEYTVQILWDIAEVVKGFSLHGNAVGIVGQRVNVSVLQNLEKIVQVVQVVPKERIRKFSIFRLNKPLGSKERVEQRSGELTFRSGFLD